MGTPPPPSPCRAPSFPNRPAAESYLPAAGPAPQRGGRGGRGGGGSAGWGAPSSPRSPGQSRAGRGRVLVPNPRGPWGPPPKSVGCRYRELGWGGCSWEAKTSPKTPQHRAHKVPPKSLVPQPEPGSLLPRELGSCMFWGPACFGGPPYFGVPVPIWGPKSFTQQLPRSHIPVIHSLRAPCPLDLGAFLGSRRTGTPRVSGVPPAHRLGAGWERGLCGTDGRKDGREPALSVGQPRKSRHREREQAGPGHFGEKRSQTRRLHPHGCHGMGGAGRGVRG